MKRGRERERERESEREREREMKRGSLTLVAVFVPPLHVSSSPSQPA